MDHKEDLWIITLLMFGLVAALIITGKGEAVKESFSGIANRFYSVGFSGDFLK